MAKGRAGAVERQAGGVGGGVKCVRGSVCSSVQSGVCNGSSSVDVRLQWWRRVLQDDH